MAASDSRTQIIIACISVAGVIAAAVIANRPKPPDPQPAPAPSVTAQDSASPPAIQPVSQPQQTQTIQPVPTVQPQPVPTQQPTQPQLGSDPDTAVVLSATPASGTLLRAGQLTNFNVTVSYRLTSLQNATLSVEVIQYDRASSCAGDGEIPVAQQVPMTAGEHTVTVAIPYKVGVSKQVTATGSIGYGASIWSNIAQRQLFKSLGSLPGYCYPFK